LYIIKIPVKYINFKVRISDEQKAKIRNALHSGSDCINIRLKAEDLTGEDLLALTQTQVHRLHKALEQIKGATIRMRKTQIKHNLKITGGFLPLLAGLAAKVIPILTGTVLPAVAIGALSGLASTGTSKQVNSWDLDCTSKRRKCLQDCTTKRRSVLETTPRHRFERPW